MARTLTALVEPEVLRWARESIGLTPLAAARKIGLSDETLVDRWEAGSAAPSIPQLREAARVYRRRLAVFSLSRPPDGSFDVMHDFRRLPDAEARLWSPELHGEYLHRGGTPLEVIWLFPRRFRLPRLMLGERAGSQQLGDAMPDDNARADDDTRKLRARFPRWGILFDPVESVWVAVRGKRTLVAASSPEKLTEQVEAAARGEAGPDEGARTQTWRALRKHGRG